VLNNNRSLIEQRNTRPTKQALYLPDPSLCNRVHGGRGIKLAYFCLNNNYSLTL